MSRTKRDGSARSHLVSGLIYPLLSMTVLPWLAFTGFSLTRHPQVDTIPLMAWGKLVNVGDLHQLPFFINFHHALVDGLHIGLFVKHIEGEARELAGNFG